MGEVIAFRHRKTKGGWEPLSLVERGFIELVSNLRENKAISNEQMNKILGEMNLPEGEVS